MLGTKSSKNSLLEVIICSINEFVFIRNLSNFTLHIFFDTWWATMKISSKQPIAWNDSRHAGSWQVHLYCGLEQSSSPGIVCIICHQVLRHPSEHGTSSMGKYLLAKAQIAKLSEITESEDTELTSSIMHESALAILKMQGSRGITIVSL
jgi:hypothetical protein